jgi:sodium-dependent dicarboxylate transporter 2/3/5
MLPATLSATCAFMLPVSTPPNAIVFGSGKIPMVSMVRAGIVLNLIGVAVVYFTVMLLAWPIFGIHAGALPVWAQ